MPGAFFSWLFVTWSNVMGTHTAVGFACSAAQRASMRSRLKLSSAFTSISGASSCTTAACFQKASPFHSRRLWFFLAAIRARVSCSEEVMSIQVFFGSITELAMLFFRFAIAMKPVVPSARSTTGPWSGSISTRSSLPSMTNVTTPSIRMGQSSVFCRLSFCPPDLGDFMTSAHRDTFWSRNRSRCQRGSAIGAANVFLGAH
mmetsp:Transcript_83830/g.271302  ORF Transcript_83830/g.271302 Transcript_83830/m.271302 type:complete len:202 (+) Transcript_83830:1722-2327(+)